MSNNIPLSLKVFEGDDRPLTQVFPYEELINDETFTGYKGLTLITRRDDDHLHCRYELGLNRRILPDGEDVYAEAFGLWLAKMSFPVRKACYDFYTPESGNSTLIVEFDVPDPCGISVSDFAARYVDTFAAGMRLSELT